MGMSEMPMEFSDKRENRKNALKHVAAGAALLGAGTGGNELLNARVKRRSGAAHPGVIASAARSVSGKPNGFKAATHVPHMAGKMGVRGAQLASLPILAAGLKHAVTGADTKKLDVKQDVVRPAVEYATYQDQMKKGQDRIGKALNESEQSRLSRHKQVGRNVSLASGTLGLAALGLRTPQAARALTNRGVKGLGRLAAKDTKATNLSNTLGVGALGIGSAGSFNYAAQQRLERKKDAVAKAAMQYTAEERRKNRKLATTGVAGAGVAIAGPHVLYALKDRSNIQAGRGRPKKTVDINTSSVVPDRKRAGIESGVKGPHAPAAFPSRNVEAVEPNRRGVYNIANSFKDERHASRLANRGRLFNRGAAAAAVGGLATYAGAMGVLDSRHQKKRNELAAQKRAAKQMTVTKGIPTKAWIKRNNLPVNVLDQDGPDHFMVVHTSSRMDGLRQRFHRDELRYATKNQTRLTPVSAKAQAKPTQMQFDFGKNLNIEKTLYRGMSIQGTKNALKHGFKTTATGDIGPGVYTSPSKLAATSYALPKGNGSLASLKGHRGKRIGRLLTINDEGVMPIARGQGGREFPNGNGGWSVYEQVTLRPEDLTRERITRIQNVNRTTYNRLKTRTDYEPGGFLHGENSTTHVQKPDSPATRLSALKERASKPLVHPRFGVTNDAPIGDWRKQRKIESNINSKFARNGSSSFKESGVGKSFLKENRNRLSPEAEAGYRHLRSERNENRAAAVGNASVAGLSGWLLSHEARHRPLNKPAVAVTGASALAAGYGALHASRVANRRNKSMNRIEDKARARAAAGLYGPGRGMTPVDTSSSKARKYATVQGMDGASE